MYRAYKWLSYSGWIEVPLSADNHFSHDKHKLNVSRSFTLRFVHLTLRSQPCMTSAYSWLSSSAAAGFGCLSWCLLPFVSGHSLWSLVNMPGWAGKLLLPYFLCVLRDTHPDLIPLSCLSLSLPLNSPPREAGSCFRACRRTTALCRTRMMMWLFCQWKWSQVRLLSA